MQVNAPESVAIPFYAVRRLAKGTALEAAGVILLVGVEQGPDVTVVGGEGGDRPFGALC